MIEEAIWGKEKGKGKGKWKEKERVRLLERKNIWWKVTKTVLERLTEFETHVTRMNSDLEDPPLREGR